MRKLLHSASLVATGEASRLSFSPHLTAEGSSIWERHLLVDGHEVLALGGSCDTCPFFFERLAAANETVSPGQAVAEALRAGVERLDPELLRTLGAAVPAGGYRACLVEVEPVLVRPGDERDYFCHEQVELFGIDPFWGLPHYPRTPYYRTAEVALAPDERLFEFVVPMVPPRWLDAETVDEYRACPSGTALALAVLDVKAPAVWNGRAEPPLWEEYVEPEVTCHWCLAHYLLDGHHKLYAAALDGRPISVLSLLAVDEGISPHEEVDRAVSALGAATPDRGRS